MALRQALDEYARKTPLRFDRLREPPSACDAGLCLDRRYIHYIDCNAGTSHTYSATSIRDDKNAAVLAELEQCDPDILDKLVVRAPAGQDDVLIVLQQRIAFATTAATADKPAVGMHVPLHETGHAIGLQHENKRWDAPSAGVTYYPECVADGPDYESAFEPVGQLNWKVLGKYDIDSMMHYGSETKCDKDRRGDCRCYPLLVATRPRGQRSSWVENDAQSGWLIHPPGGFSKGDLNAIYQMYPPRLGTSDAFDHLGAAMAAADFNGDGYSDLAVGAPDDVHDGLEAGGVYVYRGTYNGLVPWQRLQPARRERDDAFGAALAARDIDGDGMADLVVGAPSYRPVPGGPHAGAAFVYLGKVRGLVADAMLHQEDLDFDNAANAEGDRFGAAIAIGNFDSAGWRDIAIGAPEDAPGGRVYVVRRAPGRYTHLARLGGDRDPGDRFGAALLAVNLAGDGGAELVVGAPEEADDWESTGAFDSPEKSGHAYVFTWQGDAFAAPFRLGADAEPGDRFGRALAAGRFRAGGPMQLVVGAPGFGSQGEVRVLTLTHGAGGFAVSEHEVLTPTDVDLGGPYPGERFELGSAFAVGDWSGDGVDDLAAGAPGYRSQGAVVLLKEVGGELAFWRGRVGRGRFGASLAAGRFNIGPLLDLAIGTPEEFPLTWDATLERWADEDPDARASGTVWVYRGEPEDGPLAADGDDDSFGSCLHESSIIRR